PEPAHDRREPGRHAEERDSVDHGRGARRAALRSARERLQSGGDRTLARPVRRPAAARTGGDMKRMLVLSALLACGVAAKAHHSFAVHFVPDEIVTVSGVVT